MTFFAEFLSMRLWLFALTRQAVCRICNYGACYYFLAMRLSRSWLLAK